MKTISRRLYKLEEKLMPPKGGLGRALLTFSESDAGGGSKRRVA
jgi:hypothetical protein